MATPTSPTASLYAAGAKKGAVWGTEVALAAVDEIKLLKSADLPGALAQSPLELEESNSTFISRRLLGGISACPFDIEALFRYDAGALGVILAEIMGTAGAPTLVETGVYLHTFQLADSSDDLFVTYCEEYPGKIYSVPSAKPQKVVFSLQDGLLKMTASMLGNVVINDSAVNGAAQLDLMDGTGINIEDEVRFDELGDVWMGEYPISGGPDSGDQQTISGFEITIDRGLAESKPQAGDAYLSQAKEEKSPTILVKLEFPYEDSFNRNFFEDYVDGTAYSLVLHWTGLLLGPVEHYELGFWFPKLVLWEKPTYDKSGLITASATFRVIEPSSAPTGFLHARPYIELQNARSTNYLA